MHTFIDRYYHYCLSGLIVILIVLSFLIGREEGRATNAQDSLILSCSPEILSQLAIAPSGASGEDNMAAIPKNPAVLSEIAEEEDLTPKGKYMGSKNGTKYYKPGCPGAGRIKFENYIWFSDEEDATMQGYSKGSC